MAILGRETIICYKIRNNFKNPPPRSNTSIDAKNISFFPPIVEDEAVGVTIVNDEDLTKAGIVGSTGVPRIMVGFETTIVMRYIKIIQHKNCISKLKKERKKEGIDPDPIMPDYPDWFNYMRLCPIKGLIDREYTEASILAHRKKAKAICAARKAKEAAEKDDESGSSDAGDGNDGE